MAKSTGIVKSLQQIPDAAALVKLIANRQNMLRDAWLTATKHIRPGLPVGLPLKEAESKASEALQEIEALIQHK